MKHVFVWWLELDREIVMHRKKANIRNIVKCSHGNCRRPAAVLDHYFPYHDEMNRCNKHSQKVSEDKFVEEVTKNYIRQLGVPLELLK